MSKLIYVANTAEGYRYHENGILSDVVINEPLGVVKRILKGREENNQVVILNNNQPMRLGDMREAIHDHLNKPIKIIAPEAQAKEEVSLEVDMITEEGEVVDTKPVISEETKAKVDKAIALLEAEEAKEQAKEPTIVVNTIKNKLNGEPRKASIPPSNTISMKSKVSRPRSRKAIKAAKKAVQVTLNLSINIPGQSLHTGLQTIIDIQQKVNDGLAVAMGWANMHNGLIDWTAEELHEQCDKFPCNLTELDDVHIYANARLLGVYAEKVKVRTDNIQDKVINVLKTPVRLAKGAAFMAKTMNEMGTQPATA